MTTDDPRDASDRGDGADARPEIARRLDRLLDEPAPDVVADRRTAVRDLRGAIEDAAARATIDGEPADGEPLDGETTDGDGGDEGDVAVAFSGGVDSAVVAALLDAPCYVVGFPESHDVAAARSAAAVMDLDLTVVELDEATLEDAVPRVADAIGRTNAMDVQIALPLFLVAERVAADGYGHVAVGQGADELFGGYAKVERAPTDPRVDATTVRGARDEMLQTLPDQLERDVRALEAAGVTPVAPLLDDEVVRTARSLPEALLVSDRGERKYAFRLAARAWVPDAVAFREKKAVQYGSLVGRELDRLARQAGYKRRMDDHVSAYVRSRL